LLLVYLDTKNSISWGQTSSDEHDHIITAWTSFSEMKPQHSEGIVDYFIFFKPLHCPLKEAQGAWMFHIILN
jgi:hypothetical protein